MVREWVCLQADTITALHTFRISRGSLRQNIMNGITGAVGTLTRVSFRKYRNVGQNAT